MGDRACPPARPPGVMPSPGFGKEGGPDLPARPVGPGVALVSRGDKEPPVTLGVCRERTKPGPGSPPPAYPCPFSLLSLGS